MRPFLRRLTEAHPQVLIIAPGDVIYDDEGEGLLDTTSDSSVAQYVASFQKLKQMDVQTTYPGHGRTLDRQTLRSMITQYLQKHA
ncbi:Uncharacterised protein [Mycobacteroides abscessus subsp. abscessus]|nr:Uncharacterised protein [Mycobacteroides abscessus subsp. abscessus]SIL71665.1 Uncharacterised protein [Mycobacteroides abscessus subsp. abscessus]SLE89623.1 Uncharacterised protein [Mycobacteroides abscessus subsp. abscessus]